MFEHIEDMLLGEIDHGFEKMLKVIQDFSKTLDIKSYADMGKVKDRDLLNKMERQMTKTLSVGLQRKLTKADAEVYHEAIVAFLESYRLMELWQETVGRPAEVLSSQNLITFPLYKPYRYGKTKANFLKLAKKFGLSPHEISEVEDSFAMAKAGIKERVSVVEALRSKLKVSKNGEITPTSIKNLVDLLLPQVSFEAGEVKVIVVRTMFFICLPSLKGLESMPSFKKRSKKQRDLLVAFLKEIKRVRFDQFSHFPGLSRFDGRASDRKLLASLGKKLGMGVGEVAEWLSSVIMIEEAESIEKFLIHDTWGHLWQADLTKLRYLYDKMVSLQLPLAPDRTAVIDGHNIVTMSDLFYVRQGGEAVYYEDVAQKYFDALIEKKVQALFAPIVAEMCADMIEYKFSADSKHLGDILPSSSIFSSRSTKLDFAWSDLLYFVKMMRRSEKAFHKNPALVRLLGDRLWEIQKIKFPQNFKGMKREATYKGKFKSLVKKSLQEYLARQEYHLNPDLALSKGKGRSSINGFFKVFSNLLRIQTTINSMIHQELEGKLSHLEDHRELLILFIAKYFEKAPLQNFWSLDETLGKVAIPLMDEIDKQ